MGVEFMKSYADFLPDQYELLDLEEGLINLKTTANDQKTKMWYGIGELSRTDGTVFTQRDWDKINSGENNPNDILDIVMMFRISSDKESISFVAVKSAVMRRFMEGMVVLKRQILNVFNEKNNPLKFLLVTEDMLVSTILTSSKELYDVLQKIKDRGSIGSDMLLENFYNAMLTHGELLQLTSISIKANDTSNYLAPLVVDDRILKAMSLLLCAVKVDFQPGEHIFSKDGVLQIVGIDQNVVKRNLDLLIEADSMVISAAESF